MAANTKLNSDPSLSRCIVCSFLHFLDAVELSPGVDLEGLEIVRECLTEVFNPDSPSVDGQTKPDSLIDIFCCLEASDTLEKKSDNAPSSSSAQNIDFKFSDASKSLGEDWTKEPCSTRRSISSGRDNQESNSSNGSFRSHGTLPFAMPFDPSNLHTDIATILMSNEHGFQ